MPHHSHNQSLIVGSGLTQSTLMQPSHMKKKSVNNQSNKSLLHQNYVTSQVSTGAPPSQLGHYSG